MLETYKKEIVQRITKNLIDIQLLRLINSHPSIWGYRIKKTVETDFQIKLGHGVLYPLLKSLEQKGFLVSSKQSEGGRSRKVYTVTEEGKRYLSAYSEVLKEQIRTFQSST